MDTLSAREVQEGLEVIELKPGQKVRLSVLKDLLPDPAITLFFGKLYNLDYGQLSSLLVKLHRTTVLDTLLNESGSHSTELQEYIIDIVPDAVKIQAGIADEEEYFTEEYEPEFLPELWDQLDVEIAASITQLVDKLGNSLAMLASQQGQMLFGTLATLNKQRQGVIGAYKAQIKHRQQAKNLVVFDVSGSMSEPTVRKIVNEVVALAYKANAAIAIVSDHTYYWDAGCFTAADVLEKAEYMGTHYETLEQVFNQDWATVIAIADYDSYGGVPAYLRQNCSGSIEELLDISLVDRPTFLSECLGQMAKSVRPLLVGNSGHVIGSPHHTSGY